MKHNLKPGEILAWHFGAAGGRLNYGKREKVRVGKWMRAEGKLIICKNGMHASRDPWDALYYAQGPILSRVVCRGEIEESSDKLVCRERKHLWQYDASSELRLFACWRVRHTPLPDGRVVWDLLTDPRSRKAVEVAERYARGRATADELRIACEAAWVAAAAAWAARDAAGDAAQDAALTVQQHQFRKMIASIARRKK